MKCYKVLNEIRVYCSGCRKVVIPQMTIHNSDAGGEINSQTRELSFNCTKCKTLLKVVKL